MSEICEISMHDACADTLVSGVDTGMHVCGVIAQIRTLSATGKKTTTKTV